MFRTDRIRIQTILKSVQYYVLCFVPVLLLNFNINYIFFLNHGIKNPKLPNDRILQFFIPYVFICYVLGLFITIPLGVNAVFRQFLSFGAFFAVWSITFVSFKKKDVYRLMQAVVYIAVLYSLWVICTLIFNTELHKYIFFENLFIYLRPYVWAWPQYFIPILMFALIYLLTRKNKNLYYYLGILVIVVCIFFSYNRTVYIVFTISFLFYVGSMCIEFLKHKEYKKLFVFFVFIFSAGLIFYIIIRYTVIHQVILNNINAVFNYIQSIFNDEISQEVTVSNRILQWQMVLEFLFNNNPVTGTGYAGIYLLPPAIERGYTGSIDGQFLETLLKMGLIGAVFFIYFYWKLVKFYYKFDIGICTGILAFILYGATHITYLSPYNGFLFFTLLSYVDSHTYKIPFKT